MAFKDDVKLGFERTVVLLKTVKSLVGDLATLKTTAKANAVVAINELFDRPQGATATQATQLTNNTTDIGNLNTIVGAFSANISTTDYVAIVNAEWAKP